MMIGSDPFEETILDKAIRFQNGLAHMVPAAVSTGDDSEYHEPRIAVS
jgi:hypothetical protein